MWKLAGVVLCALVLIGMAMNEHKKKVDAEDMLRVADANARTALSKANELEDKVSDLEDRLDTAEAALEEHHITD